jgi:hypothetical protein
MSALSDLHGSVQKTLETQRLGRPVFVRHCLQVPVRPQSLLPLITNVAAAICSWIGQPLARLYSLGSPVHGHLSLVLGFGDGSTAIAQYIQHRQCETSVDLLVLGSHGALFHESCPLDSIQVGPLGDTLPDAVLLSTIEQAIAGGKPVDLPRTAQP